MPRLSPRKANLQIIESLARDALDSQYGVRVLTNNPERVKTEFFTLRQELVSMGDDSLSGLTLRVPASESGSVWFIPKEILE